MKAKRMKAVNRKDIIRFLFSFALMRRSRSDFLTAAVLLFLLLGILLIESSGMKKKEKSISEIIKSEIVDIENIKITHLKLSPRPGNRAKYLALEKTLENSKIF